MAVISENDNELGPMRTTGDLLCASKRAFDRNPLFDS
jgi:hypothetical protein